jgi:uncharacterized membrane protein (DUF485 family)
MRDGFLYYFLLMAARRLPMLLFATGAIVFVLIRWKQSPRASLMTAIAFVIYLFDWVLFTAFLYWFPELIQSWRISSSTRAWINGIIFFVEDFVTATIFILLTAAAFSGRNKEEPAQTT